MIGAIIGFSLIGIFLAMPLLTVAIHLRYNRRTGPLADLYAKGWERRSPLDNATIEYVEGRMPLAEFEAISENYTAGRASCRACGRFPVDGDGLCEEHHV